MKKFFIILFTLICILPTNYKNIYCTDYNSNIVVKGLTLKSSLIQTAYEIYSLNIENLDSFNKETYKNISRDSYKHYKWLKKTYNNMDKDMKLSLKNIFQEKSHWYYTNCVINLDDNASLDEIIRTIINDSYLNLSKSSKENFSKFFNYFYTKHFKSYFYKNKIKYQKLSYNINQNLSDKNVDIISFMELVSGIEFDKNYKSVFYLNFNPIQSQGFLHNDIHISTISKHTTTKDILNTTFHEYSHYLFESFTKYDDFISICNKLKKDKELIQSYNKVGKYSYTFVEWCEENLIEGFSKYLSFRYYQGAYESNNYVYDLQFYKYLREINFNPNSISLKETSFDFYNKILSK